MNTLRVFLYSNGQRIAASSNIKAIKRTASRCELIFQKLKIENKVNLMKNDSLEIEIFLRDSIYSRLEFCLSENVTLKSNSVLKGYSNFSFYNQDVVDIFFAWEHKLTINWRNLTERKKKAWLIACLYWSGIPKFIRQEAVFVIDCAQTSSSIDFYCLLGEVFIGERGYLGQNLDGLHDCLCGVDFDKKYPPSVLFKSFDKLKLVLNKKKTNYSEVLLEIFRDCGLKYRLE